MDEKLQKKLIRQLRAIRFWLGFLGVLMIAGFAILGFLIFKLVTVINTAQKGLETLQSQASQTLQVKNDLCKNALAATSSYCK